MRAPNLGSRARLRFAARPEAFDPDSFNLDALDPADYPIGKTVELEGHTDVFVSRGSEPGKWVTTQFQGAGEPTPPTLPFTRVELSNEYGCRFPLWAHDANGDGPFFEESLVSPALAAKLRAWAAHFDQYYDPEDGWQTSEAGVRAHRETGFALERELRAELGPGIEITVSFWETDSLDL